jgi:hypothetical protein
MTRNCTKSKLVIFGRKKSGKLAKKGRLSHRLYPSLQRTSSVPQASAIASSTTPLNPSKTPLRSFKQCSQVEHSLRPRGQRLLTPQSLPEPPSGATLKLRRRLQQNRLLHCSASMELMPVPWYVFSGPISKTEMAIGTPGPGLRRNCNMPS